MPLGPNGSVPLKEEGKMVQRHIPLKAFLSLHIKTISILSTMSHCEHQERLFSEYKLWCVINPDSAREQYARWISTTPQKIFMMPINEQITYADYVTSNLCKLDKEIVVSSAKYALSTIEDARGSMTSCAYGNIAMTIHTLSQWSDQKELRDDIVIALAKLVAIS